MTSWDTRDSSNGRGSPASALPSPRGVVASLELTEVVLEVIAERAADIALARLSAASPASPYLTVAEAAEYLRAKPQRVHDLLSARRLTRYKEGSRTLVSRAELEAHVATTSQSRVAPPLPQPPQDRIDRGVAA